MTTGGIFFTNPLFWSLLTLGQILLVTVVLLIGVAFLILFDRKVWAAVQWRKGPDLAVEQDQEGQDRKSTRLNSSHQIISYAVFCLKKKIRFTTFQARCRSHAFWL